MVIWLIGLSGAGKTTIGKALHARMKAQAPNTVFIDGDEVRKLFGHDSGPHAYTTEGRRENAQRMTRLCSWLDRQGVNVVCCILSIFPEDRIKNPKTFSRYFEVYISVPMAELERRDSKGLYAAARKGSEKNVVGVDIPFPEPDSADLVLKNHGPEADPNAFADIILERVGLDL